MRAVKQVGCTQELGRRLDEALEAYWNAAYVEGQSGATHDTEDGRAQCAPQAVRDCVQRAIEASARYEKVRCLNPREFAALYESNIRDGTPFDTLVDALEV
jgi:hypothetical protein